MKDTDTPVGADLKSRWKIFAKINLKEAFKDITLAASKKKTDRSPLGAFGLILITPWTVQLSF